MKTTKFLITGMITALGWLAPASGSAEDAQNALWNELQEQENWTLADLIVPGLQGSIKAFVTGSGEARFESIGEQVGSRAVIDSKEFKRYKNQASYLKECDANSSSYPAWRNLKKKYQMNMKILATQGAMFNWTARLPSGESVSVNLPDSTFKPIDYFKLRFIAQPNAVFYKSGDLTLNQVEQMLTSQFRAQAQEASENGEIRFDFTSLDDVVCDLVAGRAQIKIQIHVFYPRAKITRETRLTAIDVSKINDFIRQNQMSKSTPRDNLILSSMYLGMSLTRELDPKLKLTDYEMIRLHGQMIDGATGQVKNLANNDFAVVAAKMDRLKKEGSYSMPVYESLVQSPFVVGGDQ